MLLIDPVFFYGNAFDEVFLDNHLENCFITGSIPDVIRIDDGNRTIGTDAKAVGLCAKDSSVFCKARFVQPSLQVFPGLIAFLARAAFVFCLIAAEKDVSLQVRMPERT